MQRPRPLYLHVVFWLMFLLLLFGRRLLASPTCWVEARGPIAAPYAQPVPAATPSTSDERLELADPWARGPSGNQLDTGYAPGQQRPGLLP